MSEKAPVVGSHVAYFSTNSKGAVSRQDAILIGFDNMPAGRNADYPPAQLAILAPSRIAVLGGSEWRNAFDRIWGVPHASCKVEDRHSYRVPEDADAVRAEFLAKAAVQPAEEAAPEPAAEAAEETAAPAKIRMVKGSKATS